MPLRTWVFGGILAVSLTIKSGLTDKFETGFVEARANSLSIGPWILINDLKRRVENLQNATEQKI